MDVPESCRVLVIDDERNIRTTLTVCLEEVGCAVMAVGSGEAALGALDSPVQVRQVVEDVVSRRSMLRRVADIEAQLAEEVPEADLSTDAPAFRGALDVLQRAAQAEAPILLRGESGTGKGVLARALHAQSRRSQRPFVTVNCPTLSAELLASELFGHARGAFTGAVRDQPGRVEAAEGGTLFLDEITEITPAIQAQLLRFLQEKRFERLGESQILGIDASTLWRRRKRYEVS